MVYAYIHTPMPTSNGLDPFLYACVCLHASFLCIHVCLSRSRLCHALCPLWACAFWYLGATCLWVWSAPLMVCLDVITLEIHLRDVGLPDAYHFSTLCDVMLVLLAMCHLFGSLCSFASLHACLHIHAWILVCVCVIKPNSYNLVQVHTYPW